MYLCLNESGSAQCVCVYVCLGVSANEFAWCITESEAVRAWMCVYERVCQCLCSARGLAQWAGPAAPGGVRVPSSASRDPSRGREGGGTGASRTRRRLAAVPGPRE